VPNVRPGGSPFGVPPGYRNDGGYQQQAAPQQAGGGSFLGTAAAAAAGMIGGSLLMNSLGGMFGGHHSSGAASAAGLDGGSRTPWDSGNNTNNDMSRDLGLNDIGRSSSADAGSDSRSAGLFDTASNDSDIDTDDSGGDFDLGGDTDIG
jgi:hypothetical protein